MRHSRLRVRHDLPQKQTSPISLEWVFSFRVPWPKYIFYIFFSSFFCFVLKQKINLGVHGGVSRHCEGHKDEGGLAHRPNHVDPPTSREWGFACKLHGTFYFPFELSLFSISIILISFLIAIACFEILSALLPLAPRWSHRITLLLLSFPWLAHPTEGLREPTFEKQSSIRRPDADREGGERGERKANDADDDDDEECWNDINQ